MDHGTTTYLPLRYTISGILFPGNSDAVSPHYKIEMLGSSDHRGIAFQRHIFVFNVASESLNKDVIEYAYPPIHPNDNAFAFQRIDEHYVQSARMLAAWIVLRIDSV